MKYCRNCSQNVQPTKMFSIAWFLINFLWIIGGGVYLLYFIFMKKKTCPICHGDNFEHTHKIGETDKVIVNVVPKVSTSDATIDKIQNFTSKMENSTSKMQKYNAECAAKRAEKKANKSNKTI